MQIDIQAHNFPLTATLRSRAERRLRFALTCQDDHIQRVVMRLSDINRAADRAGRNVMRKIDRHQSLHKYAHPTESDFQQSI